MSNESAVQTTKAAKLSASLVSLSVSLYLQRDLPVGCRANRLHVPLGGKDLSDAIKRQVEFYFSRANLANDAFLVSQMNSQMYALLLRGVGSRAVD
jgi:hypothetical protein